VRRFETSTDLDGTIRHESALAVRSAVAVIAGVGAPDYATGHVLSVLWR